MWRRYFLIRWCDIFHNHLVVFAYITEQFVHFDFFDLFHFFRGLNINQTTKKSYFKSSGAWQKKKNDKSQIKVKTGKIWSNLLENVMPCFNSHFILQLKVIVSSYQFDVSQLIKSLTKQLSDLKNHAIVEWSKGHLHNFINKQIIECYFFARSIYIYIENHVIIFDDSQEMYLSCHCEGCRSETGTKPKYQKGYSFLHASCGVPCPPGPIVATTSSC